MSAQTFNGTTVTSGPFHSGNQYFNHGSTLDASAAWAVGGGQQEFRQLSRLNASAANAVGGGGQFFYDSSSLNASTANAISFGTQRFFDSSVLNASAANAVANASQYFNGASILNATAASALNGGTQWFEGTSKLNASVANAVSGGSQTFRGSSQLNASAANAVTGGQRWFFGSSRLEVSAAGSMVGVSQMFFENSSLRATVGNGFRNVSLHFHDNSRFEASAADSASSAVFMDNSALNAMAANAISSGTQNLRDNAVLNAYARDAITGGTLWFRGNAILNAAVGDAVNGGKIYLQDNASVQVKAHYALTNAADIYFYDSPAQLVLNGYNTTVGKIFGGGSTNQIRNGDLGDAILTVDSSVLGDSLFYGVISDGGAGRLHLTKTGAGRLFLFGHNSYTGNTLVNGGELVVAGSIVTTALTIGSGGRLSGYGTVGHTTIASGGTVNSDANALKVSGNIKFSPGAFYEVTSNGTYGSASRLSVSGNASLNGSVVHAGHTGPYSDAYTFTILTAGAVSGSFDSVSTALAFYDANLVYGVKDVKLTLERNSVTFAGVGQTENQDAAAEALEALGSGHALYGSIAVLDAESALVAFDALSGEIHASAKTALIEDSRFVRNAAMDRIRTAFAGSGRAENPELAFSAQFAGWGHAFGSWGDSDGEGSSLSRTTGGLLTGIDGLLLDTWRVGVLTGFSRSSFDVRERRSSGTSDNAHFGLYGGTQWAALGLRGGAAYSWHDMETERDAVFPSFSERLTADYDGGTAQVFGELGYRVGGAVNLEPFAGLSYVGLHSGGYRETGGAAAVASRSTEDDVTFSTLGLRGSFVFALGGFNVTAHGMAGWRHAFGDTVPVASHTFVGGDTLITVGGVPIAEDAAVIEASLDVIGGGDTTLNIGYSGQLAREAQDHGVTASLTVRF